MNEVEFHWSFEDATRGQAVLARWSQPPFATKRWVEKYADLRSVAVSLVYQLDAIAWAYHFRNFGMPAAQVQAAIGEALGSLPLGARQGLADAIGMGAEYRATMAAIRNLVTGFRRIDPAGLDWSEPVLPPPVDELPQPAEGDRAPTSHWWQNLPGLPKTMALAGTENLGQVEDLVFKAAGYLAAAVVAWHLVDRAGEVLDGSAKDAVAVKARLDELQWRYAQGLPLPPPPPPPNIDALARQTKLWPWLLGGVGLVAAGGVAYAYWEERPKRHAAPREANPSHKLARRAPRNYRHDGARAFHAAKDKSLHGLTAAENRLSAASENDRAAFRAGWLEARKKASKHNPEPGDPKCKVEVTKKVTCENLPAPKMAAAKKPKRKKNAKKKRAKKRSKKKARKKNPRKRGYSKATVRGNVRELRKGGRSKQQAAAVALKEGRAAWRKKHKRGAFPKHLETPAERKAMAKRKRKGKKKARRKGKR